MPPTHPEIPLEFCNSHWSVILNSFYSSPANAPIPLGHFLLRWSSKLTFESYIFVYLRIYKYIYSLIYIWEYTGWHRVGNPLRHTPTIFAFAGPQFSKSWGGLLCSSWQLSTKFHLAGLLHSEQDVLLVSILLLEKLASRVKVG